MARYLVLLRGINVGGRNKVPMATLRALLESHGHTKVSTYIASGNVILSSDQSAAAIKRERPKMIAISHGDTSTTMLQPLAEIGALCRRHDVLLYVDCTASLGGNAEVEWETANASRSRIARCRPLGLGARATTARSRRARITCGARPYRCQICRPVT